MPALESLTDGQPAVRPRQARRRLTRNSGVLNMRIGSNAKVFPSLAVALAAMLSCADARAQTADPPQAAQAEPVSEVVVTGLKRDTTFLEAPVSASVFTDEAIQQAGIARPADFLALTPNVTFIQASRTGDAFVNIRGQTSVRGSESAVAFVVDGVQLATQDEFNGDLFDIRQIEVLKGPQGALYGRNAAGGAIVISTQQPGDELSGSAKASFGNWNSMRVNGTVGGAIIPGKLRFRAAASLSDTDGAFTSLVSGEKVQRLNEKVARLRFDYAATENFDVDLRLGASHFEGGALGFNPQLVGAVVGGVLVERIDTNSTDLPYMSDVTSSDVQDKRNASLKLEYRTGIGTLTAVTAWSTLEDGYYGRAFPYSAYADPRNDFGIFEAIFGDAIQKYRIETRALNQELRFASDSDRRLRWMLGLYYLDFDRLEINEQSFNLTGAVLPTQGIDGPDSISPTFAYSRTQLATENFAPFGNLQYDVLENLELAVALRYDREKRSIRDETPDIENVPGGAPTYNGCVLTTGLAPQQCRLSNTFTQLQPKVTLTYKVPARGSVFLSYGQSFKSGGFNSIGTRQILIDAVTQAGGDPSLVFVQDAYGKETADSYEIGFKSDWLDHRLSLNGAVFRTDVDNAQQFEFFPTAGVTAISQIDATRIEGAELEAVLRPTDDLSLSLGGGRVDSKIVRLAAHPDFEGNRTPYAANFNFSAAAQHRLALPGGRDLVSRLDYSRIGSIWYDSSNLPGSRRDPVGLLNARFALGTERWQVALWSKNLLDKRYNAEAVPLLSFVSATYKAPGRSYGIEARVDF